MRSGVQRGEKVRAEKKEGGAERVKLRGEEKNSSEEEDRGAWGRT